MLPIIQASNYAIDFAEAGHNKSRSQFNQLKGMRSTHNQSLSLNKSIFFLGKCTLF